LDGDIPSKSYSEILKKVKDDYDYLRQLAEEELLDCFLQVKIPGFCKVFLAATQ
jgi:hypothetical protein